MEIFNNIIEDLFELYGFTMNERYKNGGYKLKRRSLKKYKKVVYIDKTRRRYKRKYLRKRILFLRKREQKKKGV